MVIHLLDLKEDNKVPGWNYAKSIEGYRIAVCGYQRQFVTMNKSEVTCKKCLKKIKDAGRIIIK